MKRMYFAVTIASAMLAQAQGPMSGGGREFMHPMGMEGGRPGRVVTGAPFSGQEITTETQTLANGTHITRTITSQFYRDASGRTRTERSFSGNGPLGSGTPKTMISIFDPVASVAYVLNPDKQTAEKRTLPTPRTNAEQPRTHTPPAGVTVLDLGRQTINGVSAQGTRHTRVIAAGEMGNDQPITVVDERWYSPDLQITVQTKHSDPRVGEVDFQVQNIQRTTPDASLFTPPSAYAVTTSSFHRGGPGGDRAPAPPSAEN